MRLDIDNLPRTIDLVRATPDMAPIPEGDLVLRIIDQTLLPYEEKYLFITDWRDAIEAIKVLRVRGAPAIGVAGAAAVALAAVEARSKTLSGELDANSAADIENFRTFMDEAAEQIATARPTAVNLQHMVDVAMQLVAEELATGDGLDVVVDRLYELTKQLIVEDENSNRAMGEFGAALLKPGSRVLTHCNAGSLATAFYGTALGVIYAAAEAGKIEMVYADETRPLCQGARLTAFELAKASIPVTLICDDMAASVMAQGLVDAVCVGADRIAANGDTANKIGTLGVAILASHFGIPFYVVAPTTTVDLNAKDARDIPIEERAAAEVQDPPVEGVAVYNPAFDVTPAELITAIITERGIAEPAEIAALV
ncbi:S-methyl-5-thioribose-1-phosphate isomerase [Anaerotardibacter muris]|uniref:S-methyl-5-thioribose-1-phosphate isomerase n=1 Tax=Anaerotardibacter muris TaxID=2941505 RepID=UPI00203ECFB3|nr:S-methyl-5-thioribose-1-phosphate isomerase [Anaerotardibacter muris]